jgi:hypothetical protein
MCLEGNFTTILQLEKIGLIQNRIRLQIVWFITGAEVNSESQDIGKAYALGALATVFLSEVFSHASKPTQRAVAWPNNLNILF